MPIDLTGGALKDYSSTLGDWSGILSGAASAGGGSNLATLPLTLLLSLIPALFGQRGQKDMSELIRYLKPSQPMYMSPNLPQVDEATLKAVMNQLGRTNQGWGWPGGE